MPDDRSPDSAAHPRPTPRRRFVARLAGVAAAWPFVRRGVAGKATILELQQPNANLVALADAVLPAELGPTGVTRAVGDFQRWMDGYQPGAEANHGYGTGKIERLTADPRPQWRAQLAALDTDARAAGGRSFAPLPREVRQGLVKTALASERGDALPNPLGARHLALALLAHFYDSPAATDLCYDAQIGRQLCRPLPAQRQQPVPLGRRGR